MAGFNCNGANSSTNSEFHFTSEDVVVVTKRLFPSQCYDLKEEILPQLAKNTHSDEVKFHLERLASNTVANRQVTGEQEKARRWLTWANKREHLKLVTTPVPVGILPGKHTAELIDVRVFTKRGPDDHIFENNKDIREKVARGNCFLRLSDAGKPEVSCLIYALKKFTGGLGDDDDQGKGDNFTWKKFFTKPLEETQKVICTRKANGEAAHLSCVEIAGELFICGGSKNVHMLIRDRGDIDLYDAPRFRIAKEVCEAIMLFLDSMSQESKLRLLKFLAWTRFTAIFEILSPTHQHVENLSHLKSGELVFITWTSVELEPDSETQLSPLPPHVAVEVARSFGLKTVDYDVIDYSEVEDRMTQIRHGYQYEGEVLYFLDNNLNVIGLLKKKTAWYIICRAIREKARSVTGTLAKSPDTFSLSDALIKVEKRIVEIQSWLDLDESCVEQWKDLGMRFIKWTVSRMKGGHLGTEDIADMFPVTWKTFMEENGVSDYIQFQENQRGAVSNR